MKLTPTFTNIVLGVIRGDLPVTRLQSLGIQLALKEGRYELKSQGAMEVVTPSVSDLACGLLAHIANPRELQPWAFFVLAESGAIDLGEVESHPQGELLISALWDASFEGKVNKEAIKVAKSLT